MKSPQTTTLGLLVPVLLAAGACRKLAIADRQPLSPDALSQQYSVTLQVPTGGTPFWSAQAQFTAGSLTQLPTGDSLTVNGKAAAASVAGDGGGVYTTTVSGTPPPDAEFVWTTSSGAVYRNTVVTASNAGFAAPATISRSQDLVLPLPPAATGVGWFGAIIAAKAIANGVVRSGGGGTSELVFPAAALGALPLGAALLEYGYNASAPLQAPTAAGGVEISAVNASYNVSLAN